MQGKERTLGELFGELAAELRTLLRREMELARTELSEIIGRMFRDAAAMAAGAVVAGTAFLVLVAAAVLLLGLVIPYWASALVIGFALAAVGFFLIQKGRKDLRQANLTPEKTTETLKETAKWAKAQLK
jgi:Flp pilus assembly protein TadB